MQNNYLKYVSQSSTIDLKLPKSTYDSNVRQKTIAKPKNPSPMLYFFILAIWVCTVIWFQPRLLLLLDMAYSPLSKISLWAFIIFINFAWLYGIYNLSVVLFAVVYKFLPKKSISRALVTDSPGVALLYTTCNDFVEASLISCVNQDYDNYKVYILDDSSDDVYKAKVDDFAKRFPSLVKVVRRKDRKAFKAGNMNNALEKVCMEKYFAIADADEILPPDFLSKLVPVMEDDPTCGFVQANHRANPDSPSKLAKDMGVGIDLHWKWYQPLRNDFGFVMFLGHGALLRRKTWEEIGGFPDIVSEDLGFAIHAREQGYRGKFVEDVICYEDFPDSVRSFRVRHMKWTRGTSEFLKLKFKWLVKAKNITWQEKLDILFPTLNLPLTMFYFLFMINANLILPLFLGNWMDMTIELGGQSIIIPVMTFDQGFNVIYEWDFYLITMLTFFSPVLCFIIGLIHRPLQLFKFLSKSTALYAALAPLSTAGVLAYMITGKAIFLVTGEAKKKNDSANSESFISNLKSKWKAFLMKSHPDTAMVQSFEIGTAIVFGLACLFMFQISFFGLCLSFAILPLMHALDWDHPASKILVHLPFGFIIIGLLLSGLSMMGMQSTFFGYGFHF